MNTVMRVWFVSEKNVEVVFTVCLQVEVEDKEVAVVKKPLTSGKSNKMAVHDLGHHYP